MGWEGGKGYGVDGRDVERESGKELLRRPMK